MVTYQYNCELDGPTEIDRPMGEATQTTECPVCHQQAQRVFSMPLVSAVDQKRMKLIDSTKATSDRPEVVTSIPNDGRRKTQPMAPNNPLLQKLPRP
ncbi:MAG: zinc ribbon domain-containing protein [Actinobacteria bacterium]|jgi:hypothetical protein|uniref:Unannotated protein n=1 Tax=freshwater metagenome TaxID=449393 RepID=A0A6J7ARP4_9ZZZZ|nr:zinc ribbon domain-containing protein [Actinomycetota bacterium]